MLLTLSTLALSIHAVAAGLGKGTLFPNGLHEPLAALFFVNPAPITKRVSVSLNPDGICRRLARWSDGVCDESKVQGREVTFSDCNTHWLLCRCPDAQMTWEMMEDRVAKLPVGVREHAKFVLAVKRDTGCVAYTYSGKYIRFHGNCGITVHGHEFGHAVDDGFSSSAAFKDAVAKSSCVPNSYANTNYVENFAQLHVCYMWYMRGFGTLTEAAGKDAVCLAPQFNLIKGDLRMKRVQTANHCSEVSPQRRQLELPEEELAANMTLTNVCEHPSADESGEP
ncbi:hypothetical protein AURDEDRAFT_169948 [Auricularia subglabra TFB-10046 SS5]|uniref:Lysine-specific metallo-endopeptidase domain-containing protein n=1 Tax=Auricularia subglabra (strain TFB-10046 / SS5) TaxID=717982 RepID=J0LK03_AURST|nr:hypothetical protein AURDEDRAFT_169948 [Auricularia subglabra TFB-10046 SS5]